MKTYKFKFDSLQKSTCSTFKKTNKYKILFIYALFKQDDLLRLKSIEMAQNMISFLTK